jgi:hypothetical protein
MPKSKDPERHGGQYIITWTDYQGKKRLARKPTKGQAQAFLRQLRDKGIKGKMQRW